MALCALGLVNEDATLAGAALAELLKLGEGKKRKKLTFNFKKN